MRYLFVLLVLYGSLFAECEIPVRLQAKNRPPGICLYCCLETAGRFMGYSEFRGLASWAHEQGRGAASQSDVERQLKAYDVPYRTGRKHDFRLVKEQTARGLPVLIGFHKHSWHGDGRFGHACIVTDVTSKRVYWIDPNSPGSVYSYLIADFKDAWDGDALVIEPKESK